MCCLLNYLNTENLRGYFKKTFYLKASAVNKMGNPCIWLTNKLKG